MLGFKEQDRSLLYNYVRTKMSKCADQIQNHITWIESPKIKEILIEILIYKMSVLRLFCASDIGLS